MTVLRQVVGDTLRSIRMRQQRTLREVSASARVSLGYLSEVERGQKEPSSELLAAICGALDVEMSELFWQVSDPVAPPGEARVRRHGRCDPRRRVGPDQRRTDLEGDRPPGARAAHRRGLIVTSATPVTPGRNSPRAVAGLARSRR